MNSSPDRYPISTSEALVSLAHQLGRKIPIMGDVLAAHDAIMQKVEENRLKAFLSHLESRVTQLEADGFKTELGQSLLLMTATAVRRDPTRNKTEHYSQFAAASSIGITPESFEEISLTLEALKQLNLDDIALLARYVNSQWGILENINISALSGIVSTGSESDHVLPNLQHAIQTVMRLQAIGLVTVIPGGGGGVILDTTRFEPVLRQEVWLTETGKNLIAKCIAQ